MTAKEILLRNGDFATSPILDTLHKMDRFLKGQDMPYAVVGGMAVVRNGAARTTMDLDLLMEPSDWEKLRRRPPPFLEPALDSATDLENGTEIDILFPGNEWEMEIEMPHPVDIAEWDENLQGEFAGLVATLSIKCAVYRSKLKQDGIETAAKDLYDLTELLKHRGGELSRSDLADLPPDLATAIWTIRAKVSG